VIDREKTCVAVCPTIPLWRIRIERQFNDPRRQKQSNKVGCIVDDVQGFKIVFADDLQNPTLLDAYEDDVSAIPGQLWFSLEVSVRCSFSALFLLARDNSCCGSFEICFMKSGFRSPDGVFCEDSWTSINPPMAVAAFRGVLHPSFFQLSS
jgi:hypothetical protein